MRPDDVPSPCVKICVLNAQQICTGCGRHIDEIATWSGADAAARLQICQRASARLAALQKLPSVPEPPR